MKARDRNIQMYLDRWRARAETARHPSLQSMRERGKICATCEAKLPLPNVGGFR